MPDYQDSKALVLNFYEELEAASADRVGSVLNRYTSSDYRFRGVHPFNEIDGADAVADTVWNPLMSAFTAMQRRQDIFMAGTNSQDGTEWVTSMGQFMGLFDNDWLGIPATGKIIFLPYVEFNRISDGKISESAFFCDIISVMNQAGLTPLPMQTGADIINPGPRTHDGLMFDDQDPAASAKTLELVNKMLDDLLTDDLESSTQTLARTWHQDMTWFGPGGIGATYTIDRYQMQHQGPFGAGLDDIVFNGHLCNYAEGNYAGWFGWPNLTMTSSGGFMGLPAFDGRLHMRVVDMYRRDGDKLAENWIFIDMLYWMMQQGVDVLERTKQIVRA
ncbi:MAG: nuclear transport factor 2 family protein [Proteobacteria bacterium]|nr:nuclear transport factor 2 family protein [Pseudomonadota bacterium]